MGKPHDVEEFDLALESLSKTTVTRQFERYPLSLAVRLWRLEDDHPAGPFEDTATENVSRGGARVRSTLPLQKGDVVWFEEVSGQFRCRAQIRGVTDGESIGRRLHLRFLDGLAPEDLLEPPPTSH